VTRLEASIRAGKKRERDASFNQDIRKFSAMLASKINIEQNGVKVALDEFLARNAYRSRPFGSLLNYTTRFSGVAKLKGPDRRIFRYIAQRRR